MVLICVLWKTSFTQKGDGIHSETQIPCRDTMGAPVCDDDDDDDDKGTLSVCLRWGPCTKGKSTYFLESDLLVWWLSCPDAL